MSFTSVTVNGVLLNPSNAPVIGGEIQFVLSQPITDGGSNLVGTEPVSVLSGGGGSFSVTLLANDDPTTVPSGTYYTVSINTPWGSESFDVVISRANAPIANLFSLTQVLPSTATPAATPFVSQIVAGTNTTVSPSSGTGQVTISSSGGGGVASVSAGDATVVVGGTASNPTVKVAPGQFDAAGAAATEQARAQAAEALLAPLTSTITSGDVSVASGVSTVNSLGSVPASAVAGSSYSPGAKAAVNLIPLPTLVWNLNTGPNTGPSLTTANGFGYAMWVNPAGHPVIGQRSLTGGPMADGGGNWTYTDLSGTALGTQISDVHNYYAVAVDGNGFIHIAGNMHSVALKYIKSNSPNSIAAFSTATMTGVNEGGMSYPQFLTLPNGNLIFTFRDESGSGAYDVKLYNTSAGTWSSTPGVLLQGSADAPYMHQMALSQNGTRLGAAFCWRNTPPYTNTDMCFIESRDGGTTWWDVTHTTQVTLPVTHASAPRAEAIPTNGSGLLNSVGANTVYDSNNHPHICYLLNDANGASNVRHTYWDGSAWQHEFVTFGSYQMSLNPPLVSGQIVVDQSVARPGVFADTNGGVFLLWHTHHDGKRDTLRLVDMSVPGSPVEFPLYNGNLGYMEPQNFDQVALRSGKLRTMLVPSPYAIAGFGDYGDALNWGAQWGAILTVDVAHIRAHAGNVGRRGNYRKIAEAHVAQGTSLATASVSYVDLAAAPQMTIDSFSATDGRIYLARLTVQASKATAGTGTFAITQKDHVGSTVTQIGSITFVQTSGQYILSTPWVPLQLANMPLGGVVTVQGKSSDVNTVTATAATLELALLEKPDGEPMLAPSTNPTVAAENSFITGVTTGTLFADWDASQQKGTSGAQVPILVDRSGNGRHMTQFGSTPMPTLSVAAVNSLNAWSFTGTQVAYMATGTGIMGGPLQLLFPSPLWTVFLVVNLTGNATVGPLLSADDSNPNGLGGATSQARVCQVQGNGAGSATAIGFNTVGANGSASQAITTAAWHVISAQRTAAGVQVWVDGTSTSGNVAIAGTPSTISQIAPITLGGRVATTAAGNTQLAATPWLNGLIARAIIFSGALNSADRAAIESGVRTVYAF